MDEQRNDKLKPFTFNVVFEPEASQEDVVEHSGIKRLIDMAIDGFSTTCFCYGQTGSGKTHTLTGPPHLVITTLLKSIITVKCLIAINFSHNSLELI